MMFFKPVVVSTFAILATAAAPTTTTSQCNTGAAQCCNSVGAANSLPGAAAIIGLLGIILQDPSVVVGLNCVNIAGSTCTQQPVCCTNNNFNGVINIGCTPISL
ncbi:fungal hydrophobin-domain-containing protein [Gautieria morchelliformis]|nr:fungal hydrophobin-domain-containing protein [Gautieria morchelliformis]